MDILANVIGDLHGSEKQDELIRRKERRRAFGGSDTSSVAPIDHDKNLTEKSLKFQQDYLDLITEDLVAWLNDIYHIGIRLDNFYSSLDNGVLLCQHANNIVRLAKAYKPNYNSGEGENDRTQENIPTEAIFYRPQVPRGTSLARGNVENFIEWCENQLGVPRDNLFHADDLLHQTNRKRFILSLLEVAKQGCRFGMRTPAVLALDASVEHDEKRIQKLQRFNKNRGLKTDVINSTSCSWELIQDVDEKIDQLLRLCKCEQSKFLKQKAPGSYILVHIGIRVYARKLRGRDVIKQSSDKNWSFLDQFFLQHDPCRQSKPTPTRPKIPERPKNSISSNSIQANTIRKNLRGEDSNLLLRKCQTPENGSPRKFLTLESEITVTSRSPSKNPVIFVEEDFQTDVRSQNLKNGDYDNSDAISMEQVVFSAAKVLNQITKENTPRNNNFRKQKGPIESFNNIKMPERDVLIKYDGSHEVVKTDKSISLAINGSRDNIDSQSNPLVQESHDNAYQSNLVANQENTLSTIPLSPQGNNHSDSFKRRKKRRFKQEVRSHSALAEILCTPVKNRSDTVMTDLEVPERIKQFNPNQLRSLLGLQDIDNRPNEASNIKKPVKVDMEVNSQNVENLFEEKLTNLETTANVLESAVKVRRSGSRRPRTKHRNSADYTTSHDSGISADLSSNKVLPSNPNANLSRDVRNLDQNQFTSVKVQRIDVPPEIELIQQQGTYPNTWYNTTDDLETRSGACSGTNSRKNSTSVREVNDGPFRKNVFVEAAEIRREFYGHDLRGVPSRHESRNSIESLSMHGRPYDSNSSVRVPLSSLSAPQTPVKRNQHSNYHHKNNIKTDDPTISDSDNYESEVKDFLNTFLTITQPLEASTPRVSPQMKKIFERSTTPKMFATNQSETTDESGSKPSGFGKKARQYCSRNQSEEKHQNETPDSIIIFADNASDAEQKPLLEAEAKVLTLDNSRNTSTSFEVKRSKKRPQTPVLLRKHRAKAESSDDLIIFEREEREGERCGTRQNMSPEKTTIFKRKTSEQTQKNKRVEDYETATSEKLGTEKDEMSSKSFGSHRLNFSIDDLESKVRDKVNDWIARNQNSEEDFSADENKNNSFFDKRDGRVQNVRKLSLSKQQANPMFTSRTATSETGIQCSLLDTTPNETRNSNQIFSTNDVISMQGASFESSKCARTEANKKKLRKLIEELENEKTPKSPSGENSSRFNKSSQEVGDENSSRSSMAPINIHIENIHVELPQNKESSAENGSVRINGNACRSKEVEKLVLAILEDKGFNEKVKIDGKLEESLLKVLKEKIPMADVSSAELSKQSEIQQEVKIEVPHLEITPRSPIVENKVGTGASWDETPVRGMSREPTFAETEWQEFEDQQDDAGPPFNLTFVKSSEDAFSKRKPDEMKELLYNDDYEMTPRNRSKTTYMKSEIGGISEASANMVFINSLRNTPKSQTAPKRVSKSPKPISKTTKNQQTTTTQGVGGISTEVADMTFFKSLREMKKSGEDRASRFRSKTPQPEVSKSMPLNTRTRSKTPDFIRQNIQSVSKTSKSKSLQSSRENLAETKAETKSQNNKHEKVEESSCRPEVVLTNADVKSSENVHQLVAKSADISESTTDMVKSNVFDSVDTIDNIPKTVTSSFEPQTSSLEVGKSTENLDGVSHSSVRSMKRRSNKAKKVSKIPLFKSPQHESPISTEATKTPGTIIKNTESSSRARSLTPKPRKDARENRSKSRIAVPKAQSTATV